MELLERLDQKKVHRKPDRSSPVGVSPKQVRTGFGWIVIDTILHTVDRQPVRFGAMNPRKSSQPIGRQEFIFVQHEFQYASKLVRIYDGKQSAFAHTLR